MHCHVSDLLCVNHHRNATVSAESRERVPNGLNKSIKIFKMLFTGYLDNKCGFVLSRCAASNVDDTISNGEYSWLSSLQHWPQMHENEPTADTHNSCTLNSGSLRLPTHTAFIKPWQTARQAQFTWFLPAVCLYFKSDWAWSWTTSNNKQSLWHEQIKQSMYRSPGTSLCTWPAPSMVCIIEG